MKNTLVISNIIDSSRALFESLEGYDFRFRKACDCTDEDLQWAEIIVGNPTMEQVRKAPSLKWIQTDSAGVNTYTDLDPSITLSNAYGAYGAGIGEYMTACVLSIDRKLPDYHANQRERLWDCLEYGKGVSNMKILSVGMGGIGKEFLKRMNLLGAECYGISRSKHEKPDYVKEAYTNEMLDQLLPEMDVVALSLPETPETINMFDEKRLSLMKRGSILINVGRGSAIDQTALVKLCKKEHFAGVCLDVTSPEPLPKNHPLWTMKRVYITPHISGRFRNPANYQNVVNVMVENLRRAAAGEPLLHVVRKETGGY